MKRNLLIVAIALLTVAFVSCKKDGVYKPKEKIAKIYKEWTTIDVTTQVTPDMTTTRTDTMAQPRYVAEEWNWVDKTLGSVVIKDSHGNVDANVAYIYDDKNRLTGLTFDGGKVEYAYNEDKKLQSMKYYEDNELGFSYDIEYEGKLPVKVAMTEYWGASDKNMSDFAKSLIPSYILKYKELKEKGLTAKATHTYTITANITWDGKNISQVVTAEPDEDPVTTTYEYDNNINPYYGMYGAVWVFEGEAEELHFAYSKNNVVKETCSYTSNNKTITTIDEYTYEYDGKYPTSVTTVYRYENTSSNGGYSFSYKTTTTRTTTYEYK
jgi:YD repeat-containing protein